MQHHRAFSKPMEEDRQGGMNERDLEIIGNVVFI